MRRNELMKLYITEVQVDPETGKEKKVSRYIGPWYTVTGRRHVWLLWLCIVLAAAAFLTAGLIPTWASMCAYVAPWYLLCLLPLFYLVTGTLKTTRMKDKITQVDKSESIGYVQHASLGLTILSAAWVIADAVFLLVSRMTMTQTQEIIFLGCGIVEALLGGAMLCIIRHISITPAEAP